jgi:hypothetical protein
MYASSAVGCMAKWQSRDCTCVYLRCCRTTEGGNLTPDAQCTCLGDLLNLVARHETPGESKDIPVTGREGPYSCETSRLPHFLHSRLTDGVKFVSLTYRLPFIPQEDSLYSFLLESESTPGP